MAKPTVAELQAQIAALTRRLEALERPAKPEPVPEAVAAAPAPPPVDATPTISEEELLAISAAVAAYLGVRAHIRQIRLLSSPAWAQQGRVSIQASHRLQG
jgi:methylmalonyl-CoA carboxyltransferase large subunit